MSQISRDQLPNYCSVSVVICCFNGAERIIKTLDHLANQKFSTPIIWEILFIDNASTDNTVAIVANWQKENVEIPLRILSEPRPGTNYARQKGFQDAFYEVIGFVDDDNWVAPDWVEIVAKLMGKYPEMGACGGYSEAALLGEKPFWFDDCKGSYAVGSQSTQLGFIEHWYEGLFWTAGSAIRKAAWQELIDNGWQPLLSGQQGTQKLSPGGEDTELFLAIRLQGWQLWYEPNLTFKHFLPHQRLDWLYLRKLRRNMGEASIGHDPYRWAFQVSFSKADRLRQTWQWQVLANLKRILTRYPFYLVRFYLEMEGDKEVLDLEDTLGKIMGLLKQKSVYQQSIQSVIKRFSKSTS